jgi:hypothetical protein
MIMTAGRKEGSEKKTNIQNHNSAQSLVIVPHSRHDELLWHHLFVEERRKS